MFRSYAQKMSDISQTPFIFINRALSDDRSRNTRANNHSSSWDQGVVTVFLYSAVFLPLYDSLFCNERCLVPGIPNPRRHLHRCTKEKGYLYQLRHSPVQLSRLRQTNLPHPNECWPNRTEVIFIRMCKSIAEVSMGNWINNRSSAACIQTFTVMRS